MKTVQREWTNEKTATFFCTDTLKFKVLSSNTNNFDQRKQQ